MQKSNLLSLFSCFLLLVLLSMVAGCGGGGTSDTSSGIFVATDYIGNILTSPDAIHWNVRSSGVGHLDGLIFGNSTFVAWQTSRSLAVAFFTSTDAEHWDVRTSYTFVPPSSAIYANGLFVAVGQFGGVVLTSPDGMNWAQSATLVSHLGPDSLEAIAYGNGTFVTVGAHGGIYYSSNGINWTTVSETFPALSAVTYGNGIFVAAGGNKLFTSSDGAIWTSRTLDSFPYVDILSLAYGNSIFVATGVKIEGQGTQPSTTLMMLISTDGVNWTGGSSTIDPSVRLSFVNGIFFLTGINGTILTSPDGVNWTPRVSGTIETIEAIAFG